MLINNNEGVSGSPCFTLNTASPRLSASRFDNFVPMNETLKLEVDLYARLKKIVVLRILRYILS